MVQIVPDQQEPDHQLPKWPGVLICVLGVGLMAWMTYGALVRGSLIDLALTTVLGGMFAWGAWVVGRS